MGGQRYIYGLFDPATGEIKYIGQTGNIKDRFNYHKNRISFDTSQKGQWLYSINLQGFSPEFEILEEVYATEANDTEKFWIEYFRMLGANLTNRKGYQSYTKRCPNKTR